MESDDDPHSKPKSSTIKVRQMEIDDVAGVFHLGETLFLAERMPNLYRTWSEFEVIEMFNGDTDFCLVAECGDRLVGFALGTTITKSNSAWKYGHLVWLGVDASHHGRGIAEKLFTRFRNVMLEHGVRMLITDTQAENETALRFFERMGFGNPLQHVYLSLNLASEQQEIKKRNGTARTGGSADG